MTVYVQYVENYSYSLYSYIMTGNKTQRCYLESQSISEVVLLLNSLPITAQVY